MAQNPKIPVALLRGEDGYAIHGEKGWIANVRFYLRFAGVGAYRDDQGKPFVLPSVLEAEKRIIDRKADKVLKG